MKKYWVLAVMALMVFSLGCRRGVPVQNYSGSTVTSVSANKLTAEDVRKAILSACAFRGWQAKELSPGLIEARLLVRGKHTVVVEIPYTAETFAVNYKDSSNMEYKNNADGTFIHPNYNKWASTLHMDINSQLARITK